MPYLRKIVSLNLRYKNTSFLGYVATRMQYLDVHVSLDTFFLKVTTDSRAIHLGSI